MPANTSNAGPPDGPRCNLRLYNPETVQGDNGETPTLDTITVIDVVDWFVSRYKSTSKMARDEIVRILRLFADAYGTRTVESMVGEDLVLFVENQAGITKANSVSRWYRTIKQPFNQAERLGKIRRAPFKMVKLPRYERGRDLTHVEFRALLRHSTPAFRRVLIFCRYCGARPGELSKATWEKVSWGDKSTTIVFRVHKTSATQTEQKPRKLYLPVPLVKLLLWIKRKNTGETIFLNSFGGPWKTRALCANLSESRAVAKLGADVKLYGCRHMFGTQAILNGTELATLQELMGHTTPTTTQFYVHLAGKDDYMGAAIESAVGRKKIKSD